MYEHEKLGLPKYYAVKCDGNETKDALIAWQKFQEIHKGDWGGDYCRFDYFGFDGTEGRNGTDLFNRVSDFKNNPTILTPTEFLNILNKKTMKHNLKKNDAVANVTAEQWEIIKAIGQQNGINIYSGTANASYPRSDYHGLYFCDSQDVIAGTMILNSCYNVVPFEKFLLKMMGKEVFTPIEAKLNDSYTAVVTPESVKVGCQEFTHQAIKEVYEATQSFK
jgi:hypothetical protein